MESGGRDPHRPLTSPEDEAVKRNTDCVYFLASPLTCKKGIECDYRHSEGARVNPRDCWFWLNGNCLNPKCLFRHPPLDALFGTPTTPSGLSLAPSQAATFLQIPSTHASAVHNSNKPSVPCKYFQKGVCLKGDRCPFMHGLQPTDNIVPEQPPKVTASVTETLQPLKKPSWSLEVCSAQRDDYSVAKPVVGTGIAPSNGYAVKNSAMPNPLDGEFPPRSHQASLLVSSGDAPSRPQSRQFRLPDEHLQNGREDGEFLRESSPGFDVLVDDVPEDPDYYRNGDDFGGTSGHEGRNLIPVSDLDYTHVSDYDAVAKLEREPPNVGNYERLGRLYPRSVREHRRTSSEKISERSSMLPKSRGYGRRESHDEIDGSDLRHRLLKQRKLDGSRSAISPVHRGESYHRDSRYLEERRYRSRNSHRDSHRDSDTDQRRFPIESSISSRLQARITLPGQASSDNTSDLPYGRGRERGRSWGRSSPSSLVNYQRKHQDKTEQGFHEDITAEARNFSGQPIRRDEMEPFDFAAPKSLAELRGAKVSDNSGERSTKTSRVLVPCKQRDMKLGQALDHQESEASLSFEDPKPLSVILKRKREVTPGNNSVTDGEKQNNLSDSEGSIDGSLKTALTPSQITSFEPSKKANDSPDNIEEPLEGAVEISLISTNAVELPHKVSYPGKIVALIEDNMVIDTVEDPEIENYEHREGEFDYEAIEGGDDGDAYEDDEYLDDDEDDDDFAKKLGVMFS